LFRPAAHAATATHASAAQAAHGLPIALRIGKQDRVDQRIRFLSGGDSIIQTGLAAVIDAIRQEDQGFSCPAAFSSDRRRQGKWRRKGWYRLFIARRTLSRKR
jgi:hypothetical protein